jgi:hypothetical protein
MLKLLLRLLVTAEQLEWLCSKFDVKIFAYSSRTHDTYDRKFSSASRDCMQQYSCYVTCSKLTVKLSLCATWGYPYPRH